MIPEDERPPIEDQPIPPYGTWLGGNPMQWVSDTGDYPRGPVLPQEHPEGKWLPGPGGYMDWQDAVPVIQEPVVVIVPGDEKQEPEVMDEAN